MNTYVTSIGHILLTLWYWWRLVPLCFQCLSRSTAVEIVNSSKVLQAETRMLLDGKLLVRLCNFIHVFSLRRLLCLPRLFSSSALSVLRWRLAFQLLLSVYCLCFVLFFCLFAEAFIHPARRRTFYSRQPFVWESKYNDRTTAQCDRVYSDSSALLSFCFFICLCFEMFINLFQTNWAKLSLILSSVIEAFEWWPSQNVSAIRHVNKAAYRMFLRIM